MRLDPLFGSYAVLTRQQLNKEGKSRAVETRLVTKQYLEFIKASQRFYRQFVLRLDRTYGGVPELRDIARTWKSDIPRTWKNDSALSATVIMSYDTNRVQSPAKLPSEMFPRR